METSAHVTARFLAWSIGLLACACAHPADTPPSGALLLQHVEMSGSTAIFRLENHSTQSIFLAVYEETSAAVVPLSYNAVLACRPPLSSLWESETLHTASIESSDIIEIKPDQVRTLNVGAQFTRNYKNGLCRLRLSLEGGTFIESKTFAP